MKAILDVNDALLANAKGADCPAGISLTRLIEEGLGTAATRSPSVAPHKLLVFTGRGGLMAGVDPLNNKVLLDVADADS